MTLLEGIVFTMFVLEAKEQKGDKKVKLTQRKKRHDIIIITYIVLSTPTSQALIHSLYGFV